ncbi:6435_t:CDS:2 [Diversispora eburnea]|uniref:6435_t:CDS:1 n=1 Tax=Diversispora eburnea TaxID=1213867 RepID=A0A9N8Z113_9GLOM|nr:6435_t:CDS:2 [Diversispora eburnea]
MAYLTRDQLDNYLKKLTETAQKPANSSNAGSIAVNALKTQPKRSTTINVPPPPKSHLEEDFSSQPKRSVSTNSATNERKYGMVHGPRVQPTSKRNSLPKVQDNNYSDIKDNKRHSITDDLSYPLETKLSLKPDINKTDNKMDNKMDNKKDNKISSKEKESEKNRNEPTTTVNNVKGHYVLSAAHRLYNSSAPLQKSTISPNNSSTKQEENETLMNKKKRDSSIQEIKRKSEIELNLNSRYEEAKSKYPPIDQIDRRSSKIPLRNTCDKSISGTVLSALGKKWHPEHFTCTHCNNTLEHVGFFEKDGKPYCHLDYHELFSQRCASCNTPIEGQQISALGKVWHPGHFFCRECGNPFESGNFMVNDGYPYCKKDWMKLFEPVSGEFVNALGEKWHRDCFYCEKPYCETHYRAHLANS